MSICVHTRFFSPLDTKRKTAIRISKKGLKLFYWFEQPILSFWTYLLKICTELLEVHTLVYANFITFNKLRFYIKDLLIILYSISYNSSFIQFLVKVKLPVGCYSKRRTVIRRWKSKILSLTCGLYMIYIFQPKIPTPILFVKGHSPLSPPSIKM